MAEKRRTAKSKAPAKKQAAGKAAARGKGKTALSAKKTAATSKTQTPAAQAAAARRAAARRAARRKPVQAVARRKDPALQASAATSKRSKRYMNEKQKERFRGMLTDWKQQLMEEVERTVSHMKDDAGHFPDPADRASKEEEFSLELRTRDRERKLIRKIDKTLELIDQDEYGYCESCGVEIGIARLKARPTATQCVDCKTLDEIKEQQTGLR